MIVQKRVPGVRILFHIVHNPGRSQCLFEFLCHAPVPIILGPVAPNNRGASRQKRFGVVR